MDKRRLVPGKPDLPKRRHHCYCIDVFLHLANRKEVYVERWEGQHRSAAGPPLRMDRLLQNPSVAEDAQAILAGHVEHSRYSHALQGSVRPCYVVKRLEQVMLHMMPSSVSVFRRTWGKVLVVHPKMGPRQMIDC